MRRGKWRCEWCRIPFPPQMECRHWWWWWDEESGRQGAVWEWMSEHEDSVPDWTHANQLAAREMNVNQSRVEWWFSALHRERHLSHCTSSSDQLVVHKYWLEQLWGLHLACWHGSLDRQRWSKLGNTTLGGLFSWKYSVLVTGQLWLSTAVRKHPPLLDKMQS